MNSSISLLSKAEGGRLCFADSASWHVKQIELHRVIKKLSEYCSLHSMTVAVKVLLDEVIKTCKLNHHPKFCLSNSLMKGCWTLIIAWRIGITSYDSFKRLETRINLIFHFSHWNQKTLVVHNLRKVDDLCFTWKWSQSFLLASADVDWIKSHILGLWSIPPIAILQIRHVEEGSIYEHAHLI